MSTPAQKLKTVLDYYSSQNETLHEKYIQALSDDKADKDAVKNALLDKDTYVLALQDVTLALDDVKDELIKAKEDYIELQVKYDQLASQISVTDKQKQYEIDELNATIQSYLDKIPQDINVEAVSIINPIVVTEVEAEAPVEAEVPVVEEALVDAEVVPVVEEVTPEIVNTPAEEVIAEAEAVD